MNKKPIESARDADIRQSAAAMKRAAQRARAIATQTGTYLVVSEKGKVRHVSPTAVKPESKNGGKAG